MRTYFSQVSDARCRRSHFDDWRGRSAYLRAAVPQRTANKSGAAVESEMTPAIAKIVFVMLAIGWYLVRYEYARRSRGEKIVRRPRSPENCATAHISSGLGILPLIFTWVPPFLIS